jgi:hypothetical protein
LAFKTVYHVDSDDDDDEMKENITLITRKFWNILYSLSIKS